MQKDLQYYFGYVASLEECILPYWRLIAKPGAADRLRSKSGEARVTGDLGGMSIKNSPMIRLVAIICSQFQEDQPFLDETGIEGNIDIQLDAVLTDFNEVKKVLEKNGLDLVR